jgi:Zn-finger nucleic acid-binding protein/ribosomal protein L40E
LRLVACGNCHTQFDVTQVEEAEFKCRCGEVVENRPLQAVDAAIHRCSACGALVASDAERCDYCASAIIRDQRQLSLICPECYGRNTEESRFCMVCGVRFEPQPVDTDAHELPCPVCGCLMPPRKIGSIGVNECGECNGLWVPGERFDRLVDRAVEAQRSADPAKLAAFAPRVRGGNPVSNRVVYRKCPVCEAFMHRRNWQRSSGVIVDTCADHGTWLDADELEQIAGFVLSGGLASRPAALDPAAAAAAAAADRPVRAAEFKRVWLHTEGGRRERGLLDSLADLLDDLLS